MTTHELRIVAAVTSLVVECEILGLVPPSREVIMEECRRNAADPLDTIREIRYRHLHETEWPGRLGSAG